MSTVTRIKPKYCKADGTDELIVKAAARVEGVVAEQKSLKETTTALQEKSREVSDRVLELEQRVSSVTSIAGRVGNGDIAGVSPAAEICKSDAYKRWRADGLPDTGNIKVPMTLKALISTSFNGSPETPQEGISVQPLKIPGLFFPVRPTGLIQALTHREVATEQVVYEQLVGYVNSAGVQQYHGDVKPAADVSPTLKVANISQIALTHTESVQLIADEPMFSQSLDLLLRTSLADKLEREIINGAGGDGRIEGLLTQATPFNVGNVATPEGIGLTIADMASRGFFASLVVMHPETWFLIQSARDDSNGYVAGGWNSPQPARVWDVPVISTAGIAPGTILVLDSRYIAVLDRSQISVRLSEHHKDYFELNLVLLRAELRAGLCVMSPGAVTEVVFDESSSSSE